MPNIQQNYYNPYQYQQQFGGYNVPSKGIEDIKKQENVAGKVADNLDPTANPFVKIKEKHFNTQYGDLTLHTTLTCHDRFLIIDDTTMYLIGASLKDAGKRLFAFTQMDASQIQAIKGRL